MKTYLLDTWEGIEIFCYIISKYKNVPFESFQSNDVIVEHLTLFIDKEESKKFAEAVLAKPSKNEDAKNSTYRNLMYELCSAIRFDKPILLSEKSLNAILNYLKENSSQDKLRKLTTNDYKILTEYVLNRKQREYEHTCWHYYYYDEVSTYNKMKGIKKGFLRFLPFGNVEIFDYEKKNNRTQRYIGKYKMYGQGEQYIRMELKTDILGEKDLHILIHVGTGVNSILLGLYENVDANLFSGTIMMIKTSDENPNPIFLEVGTDLYNEEKDFVKRFFKDKAKNKISVTTTVHNEIDLIDWFARQESKLSITSTT